jgi:hypothetical protein
MIQNGDGQASAVVAEAVTFDTPAVGEVLAERYRLEERVGDDGLGRQVWRSVDVILRRPVAVVLRYPGGGSASGMLSAAVAASRLMHPHLAAVYDAIAQSLLKARASSLAAMLALVMSTFRVLMTFQVVAPDHRVVEVAVPEVLVRVVRVGLRHVVPGGRAEEGGARVE